MNLLKLFCKKFCCKECEKNEKQIGKKEETNLSDMLEAKIDDGFFRRRAERFSRAVCADGIERTSVYKPFSPSKRSCLDCHHLDLDTLKNETELSLWCNGTYRDGHVVSERIGNPDNAERCPIFVLLGITAEYVAFHPQTRPGESAYEESEYSFKTNWLKSE
jgi:hypothetical protein